MPSAYLPVMCLWGILARKCYFETNVCKRSTPKHFEVKNNPLSIPNDRYTGGRRYKLAGIGTGRVLQKTVKTKSNRIV